MEDSWFLWVGRKLLNWCLNFVTFGTVLHEICWWAMGLMSSVPIYPYLGRNFHVDFGTINGGSFIYTLCRWCSIFELGLLVLDCQLGLPIEVMGFWRWGFIFSDLWIFETKLFGSGYVGMRLILSHYKILVHMTIIVCHVFIILKIN